MNALLDEGQQQHIFRHEVGNLEQVLKLALAYEYARQTVHKRSTQFRPRVHVVQEQLEEETEVEDKEELSKKFDNLTEKVALLAEQIQAKFGSNQSGVNRRLKPQVSVLGRSGYGNNRFNCRGEVYNQRQVPFSQLRAGYTGQFMEMSTGNAKRQLSTKQGADQASR